MFGCPVYMLEPKLQDGKNIPKWSPWARIGMFLWFLSLDSSLVPLVLNVCTGRISPQYHIIFDDKFKIVVSLSQDKALDVEWNQLFKFNRELYFDVEYDQEGRLMTSHLPDLCEELLDPSLFDMPPGHLCLTRLCLDPVLSSLLLQPV